MSHSLLINDSAAARIVNAVEEARVEDTLAARQQEMAASGPRQVGNHRVTINEETGRSEARSLGPVKANSEDARPTASFLDTARDRNGRPLTISELTPDSIVRYNGMEMRLQEAEMLGAVVKKDGMYQERGYANPSEGPKPAKADAPVEKEAPDSEAEAETDLAVNTMNSLAAADGVLAGEVFTEVLTAATEGAEPSIDTAKVAQALGYDSEGAAEGAVNHVVSTFQSMADRAVQAEGVADPQAFYEWLREGHKPALSDALNTLMWGRSPGKFASLARQYINETGKEAALSDDDLMTAELGDGITAERGPRGEVVLDIPGRGKVSAKMAIAKGWVRLSGS